MSRSAYTARKIIAAYLSMSLVFTLAASLIWAINTIFLIRLGGLSLFQVMLVNAIFTLGQMVFEVPTGVVADTIGRRASILLSLVTLVVSTLFYVLTPRFGWGFAGFAVASVVLGLGYTFQTGAVDAWLVDALDSCDYEPPKERVFAKGQIAASIGMLAGSLLGGVLGQIDLVLPYLVRAGLIVVCAVIVAIMVHDAGFERRPLQLATFGAETRRVYDAGVQFGWHSPVIRPLLLASAMGSLFFFYGFYAWQPYVLGLLGRPDAVWLLGVVQAGFSAAGIVGAAVVGRIMGSGTQRRDPAKVLEGAAWINAALAAGIGAVGFLMREPGIVPAAAATVMWLTFGVVFGVYGPVRMGFINDHIPSSERATLLSLDAFFGDAGGAVGQPGLGWISDRFSVQLAWVIGGVVLCAVAPFNRRAGAAARKAAGRQ